MDGQCVHEELTTPDLQNQLQLTIPCTISKQKVRNELSLYLAADGGGVDLRDWGRTWYRTEGWDEEAPAATRHHFDLKDRATVRRNACLDCICGFKLLVLYFDTRVLNSVAGQETRCEAVPRNTQVLVQIHASSLVLYDLQVTCCLDRGARPSCAARRVTVLPCMPAQHVARTTTALYIGCTR